MTSDGGHEIPVLATVRTGFQPWAWHVILCETCRGPLDVSNRVLEGVTIHRCKRCRTFRVEGDTQVINGGPNAMGELRLRAIALNKMKVDEEAMRSPWEDPRWDMVQ